jgi:hypothetical protein
MVGMTCWSVTALAGDQKSEDQPSWCFEIMDRANQPILTVGFSEVLGPNTTG